MVKITGVNFIAISLLVLLTGCQQKEQEHQAQTLDSGVAQAAKEPGQFLVIQETAPGQYKVIEQHPSNTGESRAILKEINGTERVLSNDELKKLAESEAKKVDDGSSKLLQEPQMHSGGLSLGETILASAAGALIGGYIANKLFNNPNFQANQRVHTPSAMSRPVGSAGAPSPSASKADPKKGFFKENPANSQSPKTPVATPTSSGNSASSATSQHSAKPAPYAAPKKSFSFKRKR